MLTCPSIKCGYQWQPRVPKPKVCPKCHRFLKDEDHDNSDQPSMERSETSGGTSNQAASLQSMGDDLLQERE